MLNHWTQAERDQWDQIISSSSGDGGLLQSWIWGEFQEKLGHAVYNVSDEDEKWFAQCVQLKAGNQWILTIPRGPVYRGGLEEGLKTFPAFILSIKKLAKEKDCFLVRFDPAWHTAQQFNNLTIKQFLESVPGVQKSFKERNPVHTLIIDTSKSEEDLLKEMKSKHRYNIRLAQKKGVKVVFSKKPKDAKVFFELMKKTRERQDFGSYNKDYYHAMIAALGNEDANAGFFLAEKDGSVIAGLLIAFFGNTAYYLHGASDNTYRALMAPHLLQWEAIKESKKRGMNYDLWGLAADPPANKQEEKWGGVTRFKKGFAPNKEIDEYIGTYEMEVNKAWYMIYKLRQKFV